jgi:hypothetical protein
VQLLLGHTKLDYFPRDIDSKVPSGLSGSRSMMLWRSRSKQKCSSRQTGVRASNVTVALRPRPDIE